MLSPAAPRSRSYTVHLTIPAAAPKDLTHTWSPAGRNTTSTMITGSSTESHAGDLALQKFLLLHTERESVSQQLDQLRRTSSGGDTETTSSSAETSPSQSPVRALPTLLLSREKHPSVQNLATPKHARHVSLPSPKCALLTPNPTHETGEGDDGESVTKDNGLLQSSNKPPLRTATPPQPAPVLRRSHTSIPISHRTFHKGDLQYHSDSDPALVLLSERELSKIDGGIKRSLTELLNSDAVKGNRQLRNWVQCRLMDAERDLRAGRRRRTSGPASE